jgi:hypothetical protein
MLNCTPPQTESAKDRHIFVEVGLLAAPHHGIAKVPVAV